MNPSSTQGNAHASYLVSNDSKENLPGATIVIFHLHTTGVNKPIEICQISASYNASTITQYILPDKDIEIQATPRSGLQVKRIGKERKLYFNESEVDSLGPQEGLEKFLKLLRETFGSNILLAVHSLPYHGYIIVQELQKHKLIDTFKLIVVGFVDTITVFRSLLKERNKEKESFELEDLATDYNVPVQPYLKVLTLDLLISQIGCTDDLMKQHAKDLTTIILNMPKTVEACIELSLTPLKEAVSEYMFKKIARAGISMDMLRNAYSESGENGVAMLLREVTTTARVISDIVKKLSQVE